MQMYEIPILLHGPLSDTPNFKVGQTVYGVEMWQAEKPEIFQCLNGGKRHG